jgi:hypothetical protein
MTIAGKDGGGNKKGRARSKGSPQSYSSDFALIRRSNRRRAFLVGSISLKRGSNPQGDRIRTLRSAAAASEQMSFQSTGGMVTQCGVTSNPILILLLISRLGSS